MYPIFNVVNRIAAENLLTTKWSGVRYNRKSRYAILAYMSGITDRIQKEATHFRAMPKTAQLLTLSYFLRSIAYPLLSLFTSAYIWKTNNDAIFLIVYYIGNFAVLPPMFIANKWLLRRVRLTTLYGIGTVLTGVSALMVVFYHANSAGTYLLYGAIYGIGNGLYWANRNFLTLRHTTSAVRSYFTGLQFSLSTVASVVVPVIAGWVIVFSHTGYELLVVAAFALLLIAGFMMKDVAIEQPTLTEDRPVPFSPIWQKARLLSLSIGVVDSALYILQAVLVLKAIGNEGILGSISGLIAILTAVASYIFGRMYKPATFLPIFTAMLMGFILSGIPLLWGITAFSVAWYLLIVNFADNFIWIANEPKLMDMMDEEVTRSHCPHYRLIIDREWFVDAGRVIALILFLGIALYNQTRAMQIIASLTGFVSLLFILPIMNKMRTKVV